VGKKREREVEVTLRTGKMCSAVTAIGINMFLGKRPPREKGRKEGGEGRGGRFSGLEVKATKKKK